MAAWHLVPQRHPPPLIDPQCPTHTRSPESHPECTYHIHLTPHRHYMDIIKRPNFTHISGNTCAIYTINFRNKRLNITISVLMPCGVTLPGTGSGVVPEE